ncbi:MAG TPA: response regulator [Chitinophagaceae bacterium]|jgi:CheY-like chemotaxis protein|nr:response regulator [Chitinophagaceae bacterium]
MAKNGPIIILEDDPEDKDILEQALCNLKVANPRRYFDEGSQILRFLRTTGEQPYLILSNVKARGMDGLELREQIQQDAHLRKKGIPFVYLSLDARREIVEKAYELTVQGFLKNKIPLKGLKNNCSRSSATGKPANTPTPEPADKVFGSETRKTISCIFSTDQRIS